MYDSLLDHDLEDETTVVADVATDLDDKALETMTTRPMRLPKPTMPMRPKRRRPGPRRREPARRRRHRIVVGRPGADVSHADGRDSAAHAAGGNQPRPQDRNHPRRVPPQAAVLRLRDSQRGQGAEARASRRAAVRPHGAGLGDRSAGKGSDPRPAAAQPGDARIAAGAQRRRLPRRHQQVAQAEPTARPPGSGSAGAVAGRCCWSKSSACARSGSSR